MSSDEMRHLLKRICKHATACAKAKGYDIDVERSLYIYPTRNVWYMDIACKRSCGIYSADSKSPLILGAMFTSYVPAIDRFADISKETLMKSPVGKEYIAKGRYVMIPVADEFAYKFNDKAVEMILRSLMLKGSFIHLEQPDFSDLSLELKKEDARFYAEVKKFRDCMKSCKTFNPMHLKQHQALITDHSSRRNKIEDMIQPVRIPLVAQPCSSFEEVEIALDMNEIG